MNKERKRLHNIKSALQSQLEIIGFGKKSKYDTFTLNIDNNTYGWLGITINPHNQVNQFRIDPMVGVHNRKAEILLYKLAGWPSAKLWSASVARYIGELFPKKRYKIYEIQPDNNIDTTINDILNDIKTYGIPWMHELKNLHNLADAVEEFNIIDYLCFRLPIIWSLLGNKEKTFSCTDKYLIKRKNNKEFIKRYEVFINKLRDWYSRNE